MDTETADPIERIERALERIAAAAQAERDARAAIGRRHETLRDHVTQAIGTLDAMIEDQR